MYTEAVFKIIRYSHSLWPILCGELVCVLDGQNNNAERKHTVVIGSQIVVMDCTLISLMHCVMNSAHYRCYLIFTRTLRQHQKMVTTPCSELRIDVRDIWHSVFQNLYSSQISDCITGFKGNYNFCKCHLWQEGQGCDHQCNNTDKRASRVTIRKPTSSLVKHEKISQQANDALKS